MFIQAFYTSIFFPFFLFLFFLFVFVFVFLLCCFLAISVNFNNKEIGVDIVRKFLLPNWERGERS